MKKLFRAPEMPEISGKGQTLTAILRRIGTQIRVRVVFRDTPERKGEMYRRAPGENAVATAPHEILERSARQRHRQTRACE